MLLFIRMMIESELLLMIWCCLLIVSSNGGGAHLLYDVEQQSYGHVQRLSSMKMNLSFYNDNDETLDDDLITTTTIPTIGLNQFEDDGLITKTKTKSKLIQYVWSINNFSDLVVDQELIFSPRFYLQEPGYRLQMMLITNTTYSSADSDSITSSYLGLFFRIVAGDYDSMIEWPYKYRTVLSVIKHQELDDWTEKAVNGDETLATTIQTKYNHTIIPNLDECRLRSAFLRPNSDIEYNSNTDGCGNRRLLPLQQLDFDEYLKHDTLLLLMTVYLNDDENDNDDHHLTSSTYQKAKMSMRYNELVSNYLWTIDGFNERKQQSISSGKIVVMNAPPFYTHPNGYLVQLFLTILPKRSAFAISIAFIQGDYDRYLQWPFPYPFEMAIVDQSPDYWKRDLTIKVKPSKSDCGTEPFNQPSGPQPEFCFLTIQSLQVLSLRHYNFLLNDTLRIRFTIKFAQINQRQRSSILLRNNRLVSEFNWLLPGLLKRFQRWIYDEQQQQQNQLDSTLLGSSTTTKSQNQTSKLDEDKTYRFVSDQFYTNGQGYLCQLVLTVSIRPPPPPLLNQTMKTEQGRILLFSLELVIIEGEYDRFLDWPFNQPYELSIVGYKNLVDSSNSGAGGQQFYFDDKSSPSNEQQQMKSINTKLIVPNQQIENGLCTRESFIMPIKSNPPCGAKQFVQMDLSSVNEKNKKMKSSDNDNNDELTSSSLSKSDEDLHLRVRIYL